MRHIPGIYIAHGQNGRSMFTAEEIAMGDVIESCPVLIIPPDQEKQIHDSILHDYYFVWPEGGFAIALGYGSLYNHSAQPNAYVIFDTSEQEIIIKALKKIEPGDEILIDYTDGDRDHKLWFTPQ